MREILKEEYMELRSVVWNELIERTEKERNCKDFWLSVKRMIGKTSSHEVKYLKGTNGEEIFEDRKKAVIFRKYWEKIFQISEEENINFDSETEELVNEFLNGRNRFLTPLEQPDYPSLESETYLVTNKEVKALISSFKQRAPVEDRITKYHLQHLPNNMITNLTTIMNACLATGYFPEIWKISIMVFIPKPGKSPFQHINYRPISLLNQAGKILEKVINNRLLSFIENNNKANLFNYNLFNYKA